jgi:hypothetical protein
MSGDGPVARPCLVCGREVRGWPCEFERYNKRYCSHACRAADVRGENHHLWKPKIAKRCEWCDQAFEVIPYFKDQKYCSRSCFGDAHRMEPVKAKCEGCGKLYEVTRGSRSRFHSMECYQNSRRHHTNKPL